MARQSHEQLDSEFFQKGFKSDQKSGPCHGILATRLMMVQNLFDCPTQKSLWETRKWLHKRTFTVGVRWAGLGSYGPHVYEKNGGTVEEGAIILCGQFEKSGSFWHDSEFVLLCKLCINEDSGR